METFAEIQEEDSMKSLKDAYRVVHYIPLWCFFGIDTKEHAKEFSSDIIKNVGFWSWFINQEPSLKKKRDISLAKGIYNASR